jgi:hypothetical protein
MATTSSHHAHWNLVGNTKQHNQMQFDCQVCPTQPLLASQTQRTSNSRVSALLQADPLSLLADHDQGDGAPPKSLQAIPAILQGKEFRVQVKLASKNAASTATTEATAMVLRPKPAKTSKMYGDGNPT